MKIPNNPLSTNLLNVQVTPYGWKYIISQFN